jgi:uridine kinase
MILQKTIIDKINVITETIERLSGKNPCPVVVAIDGASGSGKSTFAQLLYSQLQAVIIPLDDFFSADIPDDQWDTFSVTEKLEKVFDWNRARVLALEPLRKRLKAKWRPFDFLAGLQQDGAYPMANEEITLNPSNIVLLEGSYSSCHFLEDLMDLKILINVPAEKRHKRLLLRDGAVFLEQWHKRWDAVETYYFEQIRPKKYFDWVIEG